MLNKNLEQYKELYSKYVEATVALHNYHISFVKNLSLDSARNIRAATKVLGKLEIELRQAVHKARDEQREIDKLTKKARKEQKIRNTSGLDPYNKLKNVDVSK